MKGRRVVATFVTALMGMSFAAIARGETPPTLPEFEEDGKLQPSSAPNYWKRSKGYQKRSPSAEADSSRVAAADERTTRRMANRALQIESARRGVSVASLREVA